jgi:putative tryptophan/tyrosine transport system substrate-binding protein
MRRREFVSLICGAAAWPLTVRAQQPHRVRRIGVLMGFTAGDAEGLYRARTIAQELQELGWRDNDSAQIDYRWPGGDTEQIQALARELVSLRPDVLIADGTASALALRQATRTIPIVFVIASDPVGLGIVQSLARPGGNATGVFSNEPSMGGKWLELLKEIVPNLRRVAVIFNPDTGPVGPSYLHSIETAATLFSVEATGIPLHETNDIERAISSVAQEPGSGLIVLPDVFTISHRKQIIALTGQHRLPTIYPTRYFATDGGLLSYGTDTGASVRRVESYVDRILKGEKPADLPVQGPTKFDLVINLKTAKALGLDVPLFLQQRADAVIE